MDEKADSMAKIKAKTFEQKKEFAIRGIVKILLNDLKALLTILMKYEISPLFRFSKIKKNPGYLYILPKR